MSFDPSLVRYSDAQSRLFFDQLAERARAVPGVKNVTMSSSVPMANDSLGSEAVVPEGYQFPVGKDNATVLAARIDEAYFDTMAVTILQGRSFRVDDGADAPRVGIVNQQFARHYWPNQDPIGKRFRLVNDDDAWVQVVGVAKTSKYIFIAEAPTEFIYLARRQSRPQRTIMLVQSAGDPSALIAPMRDVVRGLDPNLPIFNVRTMEDFYRTRSSMIINVLVGVVGAMGVMGLGLAIVGLYGLVAYAASRRTREIGIRMAIGANRGTVLRMVLREGITLAAVGLAIGLVLSVVAGELLAAAFPTGDNQRDLVAPLIVIPIVLAVTFVAAYVPARRASSISPMRALRYE
jgi:putative ABC transport system permease protein